MKEIDKQSLYVMVDITGSIDTDIINPAQLNTLILSNHSFPFKKANLKSGDLVVIKFLKSNHIDGLLCKIENFDILGKDNAKLALFPLKYVQIVQELDYNGFSRVKIEASIFIETSDEVKNQALKEMIKEKAAELIRHSKVDSVNELKIALNVNENLLQLSDILMSIIKADSSEKKNIMAITDIEKRAMQVIELAENRLTVLREKEFISVNVQHNVGENQKKYFLNEQLRIIKKELGYNSNIIDESEDYKIKIKKAKMPDYASEKASYELNKLVSMAPTSPEATVIRSYLDWIIHIPWFKMTKDNLDIQLAEKILHRNHYGLDKIKERVLEFLSVMKLTGKMKGQIICFVGPPGVGKTSLGQSIAESMGRKFIRISLGGVRDEAEIRGHRKTYIGSLPGKILQMMRRSGVMNPVFMLDEVDKLGSDFKGDPSSALLEVLDPQLNHSFMDHYLELEYNLSNVLFICTANVIHNIPPALRDRMEIINLPGYLDFEKFNICKKFLIPKSHINTGLKKSDIDIKDETIKEIVRNYILEAGVRNLEKSINKIMRKVAREKASGKLKKKRIVSKRNLIRFLGPVVSSKDIKKYKNVPGLVNGLAWTQYGGNVLTVETLIIPGNGELHLTGQLGDVLKESARASISFLRKEAKKYSIDPDFYKKYDIHIHLPEGAIPKDGPSAGITITCALYSSLTKKRVKRDFAMTGEITLNGIILPIGGLAEKIVAAQSAGLSNVLIPYSNKPQYDELPSEAKKNINVFFIKTVDDAINLLFN